jgi:hypothetical protein
LIGKVIAPGLGAINASQMLRASGDICSRTPLARERAVSSKPAGSTA